MWTGERLSRSSYLYAAVKLNFFTGRVVNFALSAVVTTNPFSEVAGTTGVVRSVKNRSFCVLRAYDPVATSFVVDEKLKPPVTLSWLKLLLGALLIVLTVLVVVAQFCHDMNGTLFLKNEP